MSSRFAGIHPSSCVRNTINHFTAKASTFSELKSPHASVQTYIFQGKSKPASNTAHFDVKTSTSDEKEATGFQLLHFIPQHVVHIACTAMKGLSVTPEMTRSSDVVVVWPAAV